MGALPIVLALSGFVLLWAIVNYNSFTEKRNAIRQMLEQRANLLRIRTELLAGMAALFLKYNASLPVHLHDLWKNPGTLSTKSQMENALAQIQVITQTHPKLFEAAEYTSLKNKFIDITNQLLKLQKSLTAQINHYNKQTGSMPYRIVATLFGFKPVRE